MTPEQEAEYRKLAVEMLDAFGEPMFDFLLTSLGEHKRLLNIASDGIWTGMRHTVMKFPPELLSYLKKYRGVDRIEKFLLSIAPQFLMQAPIENIEQTLTALEPYLKRLEAIKTNGGKTTG